MTETTGPTPATVAAQIAPKLFTQAEVDRIVDARLARARNRPQAPTSDASDATSSAPPLGVEPDASPSAEERLLELRDRISAECGFHADDRDVLLTGADEATLRMQAERMTAAGFGAMAEQVRGNVAPREGRTVQTWADPESREMREFVNALFDRDPYQ